MVRKAWEVHCMRTGINPINKAACESWYRQQLMEAIGVYTTVPLNKSDDFDTVMLHFAQIANDDYWIDKLAHGKETRMRYLIRCRLQDLDRLDAAHVHTWAYTRAIYDHMGLPTDIEDCPAQLLWKVFQALDSQVRRLANRLADVPF